MAPVLDGPTGIEVSNFAAVVQCTRSDVDGVLTRVASMMLNDVVDFSGMAELQQALRVDTGGGLGNLSSLLQDLFLSETLAFCIRPHGRVFV